MHRHLASGANDDNNLRNLETQKHGIQFFKTDIRGLIYTRLQLDFRLLYSKAKYTFTMGITT